MSKDTRNQRMRRLGLTVAGCLLALPVGAAEGPLPPPGGAASPMDRAQYHLREALQALGEAGNQTYQEKMPEVMDATRKALDQTRQLLHDWERKLETPNRPQPVPPGHPPPPGLPPPAQNSPFI